MSIAPAVAVSVQGAVGILQLSRPDKFNCLTMEVHRGLDAALTRHEAPGSGVRALLIRAQGAHFCTGADLDAVQEERKTPESLARFLARGHATLRALETSPKPVVVAVQGLCLAGGLELMLACDVVFAANTARFGDQHAQFGLVECAAALPVQPDAAFERGQGIVQRHLALFHARDQRFELVERLLELG